MDEDAVIAALTKGLPQAAGTLLGPGDDSAVVALPDGRATVTTDILVEGVHFRDAWSSGFDVGWRLAAQNLADAAAMGATPKYLVVALAGPPGRLGGEWGASFARGLDAYCRRWGVGVVGGDLSRSPVLTASGTALGDLEGRAPVTRSGARPGDVVALSDAVAAFDDQPFRRALGGSAAGLAWLDANPGDGLDANPGDGLAANPGDRIAGNPGDRLADGRGPTGAGGSPSPGAPPPPGGPPPPGQASPDRALISAAVAAYLRPDPPLDLGQRAATGGATAMMDVSDGLAKDAGRMARASAARLLIDLASPVLAEAVRTWAPLARTLGADAREWVAGGGEDHALLATFPAENGLPDGWHGIGQVVAPGEGGPGARVLGAASVAQGWDHFG